MRRRAANMPRTIQGSPPPRSCMVDADALAQLTGALVSRQRTADALALAECAARVQPGATAYFNHGYALQMAGRHADAVAPYRAALALDADRPSLRNNRDRAAAVGQRPRGGDRAARSGGALRSTRRRRGLISSSRGSRRTTPRSRARSSARRQRARDEQRRAGDEGGAALGRRRALRGTRVRAGARRRVVPFQPGDHPARARQRRGRLARSRGALGRRGRIARPPAGAAGPRWQGEPLAGKTLLVWGEQPATCCSSAASSRRSPSACTARAAGSSGIRSRWWAR